MQITYNKKFLKKLSVIPVATREKIEKLVFEDLQAIHSLKKIKNLKKLKGYSQYFRIRVGDFRRGIKCNDDELSFERILHRKEIYNTFHSD